MRYVTKPFLLVYAALMLLFVVTPMICIGVISFAPTRFLNFPFPRPATLRWYEEMVQSLAIREAFVNSLVIASIVTVISIFLATCGALAFVRYSYKGRKLFQRLVLLPVFFPQSVLGLILLVWFSNLGVPSGWFAVVLGQIVWIAPVVTLIISIQIFGYDASLETAARDLGAKPGYVFRRVTLPLLAPGILSGGLFAFLLSWVNFPISYFTSGVDSTVPVWLHTKSVLAPIPSANALGFVIFLVSFFLLIPPFLMMNRKGKS
jgi:spermidine/putrescine transport system permease protein